MEPNECSEWWKDTWRKRGRDKRIERARRREGRSEGGRQE
jgi:hypothetical protein